MRVTPPKRAGGLQAVLFGPKKDWYEFGRPDVAVMFGLNGRFEVVAERMPIRYLASWRIVGSVLHVRMPAIEVGKGESRDRRYVLRTCTMRGKPPADCFVREGAGRPAIWIFDKTVVDLNDLYRGSP